MTRTNYPTDLTDAQWEKLLPYLPEPSTRQTAQVGDALNYQRYILSPQVRVSVAPSSDATMANGLLPLQKVESLRYMVYDSSSTS